MRKTTTRTWSKHLVSWLLFVVASSSDGMMSFVDAQLDNAQQPSYPIDTSVYKLVTGNSVEWIEGSILNFNENRYEIMWSDNSIEFVDIKTVEKYVGNEVAFYPEIDEGEYEDLMQEKYDEDALITGHIDSDGISDIEEEESIIDGQHAFEDGTVVATLNLDGTWRHGKINAYEEGFYTIKWDGVGITTLASDDAEIYQLIQNVEVCNCINESD